jgi:hypothetical protein
VPLRGPDDRHHLLASIKAIKSASRISSRSNACRRMSSGSIVPRLITPQMIADNFVIRRQASSGRHDLLSAGNLELSSARHPDGRSMIDPGMPTAA